jgi:predicted protein tyrosine phosphatase
MKIENIAAIDFQNGYHKLHGKNTIAIQICDPCGWVPKARHEFFATYQFEFLDISASDLSEFGEFGITDDQAKHIADILIDAKDKSFDVTVHCTAGICRSGAVVEVATMLGFIPVHNNRTPNTLVKRKLMKELGLTYE